MTPHHLTARAAAWSLQAARTTLTARAHAEARSRGEALIAAGPIPSRATGVRHSIGNHSDPVSARLLTDWHPTQDTTWLDLQRRLDGKLTWLSDAIHAPPGQWTALERIIDALPALQPGTARVVAQHLADEDRWVRDLPGINPPPNRRALPGIACPHCGERQLQVLTAGPVDGWTVVCATGRPCVGQGCGCGMDGASEGAPHIWPRADVIGAVAGAAPKP